MKDGCTLSLAYLALSEEECKMFEKDHSNKGHRKMFIEVSGIGVFPWHYNIFFICRYYINIHIKYIYIFIYIYIYIYI